MGYRHVRDLAVHCVVHERGQPAGLTRHVRPDPVGRPGDRHYLVIKAAAHVDGPSSPSPSAARTAGTGTFIVAFRGSAATTPTRTGTMGASKC